MADRIEDGGLTKRERMALAGKLPLEAFNDVGMDLFKKGLATLDPLLVGHAMLSPFELTDKGRFAALAARQKGGA